MDATVGLPATVRACLFDLDGVLTDKTKLHAAAWKQMFDGYLTVRAQQTGKVSDVPSLSESLLTACKPNGSHPGWL